MIKRVSGVTQEPLEVKALGDTIVIDGVTFTIEEVNTYKEEYDELHNFDYTVKKVEVPAIEEELEETEYTEEIKKELQAL